MREIAHLEDSMSVLYHSLRATRRRQTIRELNHENGATLTTRELARAIAASEQQVSREQATGEEYRNAYNALSQTHLPTLADADIIIYDSDRQVIKPGRKPLTAKMLLRLDYPVVEALNPKYSMEKSGSDSATTD